MICRDTIYCSEKQWGVASERVQKFKSVIVNRNDGEFDWETRHSGWDPLVPRDKPSSRKALLRMTTHILWEARREDRREIPRFARNDVVVLGDTQEALLEVESKPARLKGEGSGTRPLLRRSKRVARRKGKRSAWWDLAG